ncbi:MAG TPA: sigma 54-interacting transcriptional regulator [Polyangiaceae bacterium]|nr:sigma 54-interacting transcriptional regulator [Polyangiaceae bacterium]
MSQAPSVRTSPEAPRSSLPGPRSALYIVHPPELVGQVIELLPGLTIGREPPLSPSDEASNAPFAALSHPTVSRRHCLVRDAFGVPVLEDLGSSNGTRVDGLPVTKPTVLLPQTVVRIGSVLGVVDERPFPGAEWTPALPGIAPAVVRARDALRRAGTGMAPVLILGETGTGKERVAAEIHQQSARPGPYIKFSCAELSRELAHSQLFGHERGAFTGASGSHRGLFAAADRGTLFLDEVGELHLELQAKLLRVLQEGEIRPLGSATPARVDVRVVAATNRELSEDVERGSFRRDLYARLSFFEVRLPALRARREDLFWWLDYLANVVAAARAQPHAPLQLMPDAAEALLLHAWPENLRGADRLVHRLLALEPQVIGRRVLAQVMPELGSVPPPAADPPRPSSPPAVTAAPEAPPARPSEPQNERPSRDEFLAVYEGTGRNVRATSKHFGKDRRQIYRWLELYGIER